MKVIIAGSRFIKDRSEVLRCIARCPFASKITEVVCGGASGPDTFGKNWAIAKEIPVKDMPADWQKYGKAAGPIRNKEMSKYADAAIIIWDGKSRGTLNMIQEMRKLNKPYFIDVVSQDDTVNVTTQEYLNAIGKI